jgi:peptide/nickel transport system substrate-binding protein
MDRREFLGGMTAVGGAALVAGSTPTRANATEPKKGGSFRYAISQGSKSSSPDPATITAQEDIHLARIYRNYLVELDEHNEAIGELAESWEPSKDAKTWRFKIRKGIQFHDGKTMGVGDAIASINHHRGETKSSAKANLAGIVNLRADGDYLVVELSSGNADFPYVLSDYRLAICPDDGSGMIRWSQYEGTGPYVMGNWEPGVKAQLTRNANYWKAGRAHFNDVELLIISDGNTRQTALRTGAIDAMNEVALSTVSLLRRDQNVVIDNVVGWTYQSMPMMEDVAPFTDRNVRLAVKYAMNRQELVDKVLRGYGTIGNDQPLSPVMKYAAKDIEQREQDIDKAKHFLKQAGLNSLDIELSVSDVAGAGATDAALIFSEQAKAAGINIKVVRESSDGYYLNVWLKKPFCMINWGGRPTADLLFATGYAADATWNETHFKNESFNKLLIQARAELDTKRRAEMYREMQVLLRDESGLLVPFFRNTVTARRSQVEHGGQLSVDWPLDGARCAERWWFA